MAAEVLFAKPCALIATAASVITSNERVTETANSCAPRSGLCNASPCTRKCLQSSIARGLRDRLLERGPGEPRLDPNPANSRLTLMKLSVCVNGKSALSEAPPGRNPVIDSGGMSNRQPQSREPQSTGAVLMVRPACFSFNPQTAVSNVLQKSAPAAGVSSSAGLEPHAAALREFDAAANALRRAGVRVIVAADTQSPAKPDAVFPNNWVSFHRDGTVVLYPMMAENRRLERRDEVIRQVAQDGPFRISRTVDLSERENRGQFLEGTGSMVLDRAHRVAYAGLSPRTHLDALGDFSQQLDYELVTFDTADAAGRAVYHTNVMMAIGTGFAVLCSASIASSAHRAAVTAKLRATEREIVDISLQQMQSFAGNVLELAVPGGHVIALSTTAWASLAPAQRGMLERQGGLLPLDIGAIEHFGGGGVRCMLAEIHLPGP